MREWNKFKRIVSNYNFLSYKIRSYHRLYSKTYSEIIEATWDEPYVIKYVFHHYDGRPHILELKGEYEDCLFDVDDNVHNFYDLRNIDLNWISSHVRSDGDIFRQKSRYFDIYHVRYELKRWFNERGVNSNNFNSIAKSFDIFEPVLSLDFDTFIDWLARFNFDYYKGFISSSWNSGVTLMYFKHFDYFAYCLDPDYQADFDRMGQANPILEAQMLAIPDLVQQATNAGYDFKK